MILSDAMILPVSQFQT